MCCDRRGHEGLEGRVAHAAIGLTAPTLLIGPRRWDDVLAAKGLGLVGEMQLQVICLGIVIREQERPGGPLFLQEAMYNSPGVVIQQGEVLLWVRYLRCWVLGLQ